MVATAQYPPSAGLDARPYEQRTRPLPAERTPPKRARDDGRPDQQIVDQVHQRLMWGLRESEEHRQAADDAYTSYYARQRYFPDDPEEFSIVVNSTMPNVNRKVAKILDGQPQIDARGRGAEDFDRASEWQDVLKYTREWTGDFHDSFQEVFIRVLYQHKIVGEGISYTGFDPLEEDGNGAVFTEWINSLHVVWARSTSQQKRNARWVIWFEPIEIEELEAEYPQLKGQISPDVPGLIETALFGESEIENDPLLEEEDFGDGRLAVGFDEPQRAYRIKQYEKRKVKKVVYRVGQNGQIAQVQGRPMTTAQYKALPPEIQGQLYEDTMRRVELWETTIVNHHVVEHGISRWDRSRGGHGQYPFAWCSNIWDPRYTHAHGDVAFELGLETLQSEIATRWVESMFIANAQFLDVVKGAYPRGEEEKLNNIGRNPYQLIQRYPGMEPAQFINSNPTGANTLAAGSAFLQEIKDNISNVYSIHRGGMPYETSGRGIGKLLAEAAIQDNLDRIRVESYLRQETILRMGVIQQAYADYRLMRISSKVGGDTQHAIYTGDTEERIRGRFGLEDEVERYDDDRDPVLTGRLLDPQGREAKILPLKDQDVNRFDIRLVLDSGRERNKAERMDLVEMFSEMAARLSEKGMGLVRWAAELLDVPDRETLLQALAEADQQTQIVQRVEGLMQNTGLSLDELEQVATQVAPARGGRGAPAGPGAAQPQELLPL